MKKKIHVYLFFSFYLPLKISSLEIGHIKKESRTGRDLATINHGKGLKNFFYVYQGKKISKDSYLQEFNRQLQ